ncbi:MAG: Peptidase bacteriocin processing [Pedosphaera sp.]|nr:Peptidase bacteriocin processing [Pedosphaera sp.]
MSPWLESSGVALLAAGGVLLGAWFSRLRKPYWLLGYFIPFIMIVLYAAATRHPAFSFVPPISWMMMGRNKFAIIGFIGSMVLTTPMLKLPNRRDRIAISLLMVCVVGVTSIWPFLAPAFNRNDLAKISTRIDSDGICLQSTAYTCGPASAVTALRKLGFTADEGELAILAHTTSATGTPPDILAMELRKRYGSEGLVCDYRIFKGLEQLKASGLTLALTKFNLVTDHYVTVLEVTDHEVIAGDPISGITKCSHDEFRAKWRYAGIVMKRK